MYRIFLICSLLFQLFHASSADVLALEYGDVLGLAAEDAGRLILFQNDRRTVNIDFNCVLFRNVQRAAQLNWKNDASKLPCEQYLLISFFAPP